MELDLTRPQVIERSNKKILEIAQQILEKLMRGRNDNSQKQRALCFDIDGTAVYNKRDDTHRRNQHVFTIYDWARRHNIAVFFLTARPDTPENREFTIGDLARSGYTMYTELIMRPEKDLQANGENYSMYKAAQRVRINRNYQLLMSFGDTLLDMTVVYGPSNTPVNNAHRFVGNVNPDCAYLLVLPGSVPVLNIKLKAEK